MKKRSCWTEIEKRELLVSYKEIDLEHADKIRNLTDNEVYLFNTRCGNR